MKKKRFTEEQIVEILLIAWGAAATRALIRPSTREVFSPKYRQTVRGDHATRVLFYTSPYFAIGVIASLIVVFLICM